jgi:hypothetical protein
MLRARVTLQASDVVALFNSARPAERGSAAALASIRHAVPVGLVGPGSVGSRTSKRTGGPSGAASPLAQSRLGSLDAPDADASSLTSLTILQACEPSNPVRACLKDCRSLA